MTNRRALGLAVATAVQLVVATASAEPILKPRKYHGPIPQSALSIRVGMMGDASNQEMNDYLDGRLQSPFPIPNTEDFGTGLQIEAAYMHKPHPQFAVRVNAGVSLLSSTSTGVTVPQTPGVPDTIPLPALDYERDFKVQLFTVELSGVYFFSDAAIKEFQPYIGGGFTLGFPHETYTESRVDQDTGVPYTDEIAGIPTDADEWGFSPGVHLVGGIIYYLNNRFGISGEGRLQLLEGNFDQIGVVNEDGDIEQATFVVDYTGFLLTLGVTYGF